MSTLHWSNADVEVHKLVVGSYDNNVFIYILFIFSVLAFLYLIFKPKDEPQSVKKAREAREARDKLVAAQNPAS